MTLSEIDTATAGQKTLTVSYGGAEATSNVYVLGAADFTVIGGENLSVVIGEALLYSGLQIRVSYKYESYEESELIAVTSEMVSGIDTSTGGQKTFKITYKNIDKNVNYLVKTVTQVKIDTNSVNTELLLNNSFSTSELKVLVTYSDGTDATVVVPTSEISHNVDVTTMGNYTLTVTHKGVSDSIEIKVSDVQYTILGVEKPSSVKRNELVVSSISTIASRASPSSSSLL